MKRFLQVAFGLIMSVAAIVAGVAALIWVMQLIWLDWPSALVGKIAMTSLVAYLVFLSLFHSVTPMPTTMPLPPAQSA